MDKQKQIEEMAKVAEPIIKDFYVTCTNGECDACIVKRWTGECHAEEKSVRVAECYYNAGYRKIPEGAVVLTEAEYNDLLSDEVKAIERDIAEYWATENVDVVAKEMHKIGYRKLDDHAICVLRKAKCLEERLRKETAEKFAERLKEIANSKLEFYGVRMVDVEDIDEICKEISEGK